MADNYYAVEEEKEEYIEKQTWDGVIKAGERKIRNGDWNDFTVTEKDEKVKDLEKAH